MKWQPQAMLACNLELEAKRWGETEIGREGGVFNWKDNINL